MSGVSVLIKGRVCVLELFCKQSFCCSVIWLFLLMNLLIFSIFEPFSCAAFELVANPGETVRFRAKAGIDVSSAEPMSDKSSATQFPRQDHSALFGSQTGHRLHPSLLGKAGVCLQTLQHKGSFVIQL